MRMFGWTEREVIRQLLTPLTDDEVARLKPDPSPYMTYQFRSSKETRSVKLRPLDDRIVVRPLEADNMSKGGIVLPDAAKEKPSKGEVLAVGPGRPTAEPIDSQLDSEPRRFPMNVAVGDVVLYAKYAGHEVELDGEKVLIFGERDVLAVVEE